VVRVVRFRECNRHIADKASNPQLQASVDRLLKAEEARASREIALHRTLDMLISSRPGAPQAAPVLLV